LTPEVQAELIRRFPVSTAYWLWTGPLLIVGIALICIKGRVWCLSGLGTLFVLFLIANELYFHFFQSIITLKSFRAINQLPDVISSVFDPLNVSHILRLLPLFLIAIIAFFYDFDVSRSRSKTTNWLLPLVGVCFCLSGFFVVQKTRQIADHFTVRQDLQYGLGGLTPAFQSSRKDYALTFGLTNTILHDAMDSFRKNHYGSLGPNERQFCEQVLGSRFHSNESQTPLAGMARGKNIVLVSLESFQHFLLGLSIEGREVTPTLNRLVREGLSFNWIFDNAGMGGSSDAEFILLTGMLPDYDAISVFEHPGKLKLNYLPQILSQLGYHTISFHGNEGDFWNRIDNHQTYGFRESVFENGFKGATFSMGIADEPFLMETAARLSLRQDKTFSYIVTLSSHHPFRSPPGTEGIELGLPKGSGAEAYFHSVIYADQALGHFLDRLEEKDDLGNTLFIFFGDHMAPLADSDSRLIENKTGINPQALEERRVPLVFWMPNQNAELQGVGNKYQNAIGGLQDIAPTILHLIGEPIPYGMYGLHLFVDNQKRGPVMAYKVPGGFAYKGQVYQVAEQQISKLWTCEKPTVEPDDLELQRANIQFKDHYFLHRFIYESNALESLLP